MTFKEYITETENNIRDYLPPEYQNADIMVRDMDKNNGVRRHGLLIRQEGCSTGPCIIT